ncbi:MAG: S49 family peptidase [Proteobacteria bacterium]|nr:S49 family peptidase [Pseudomonadota bacterium]MBI3497891.1 S49 family peptidase [Pseudomonadota bacterium]
MSWSGRLAKRLRQWRSPPPTVAVLRLSGPIMATRPFRGMSLESMAETIERAFELPRLKAVALVVNSPGGSAVQAALIHKRIRDLAQEKKVPVFAFAEDVAASGGYWLMTAADELYANEASIVGSIGVIYAGFGFPELMRWVGVERRLYTSGVKKSMLDPYRPERREDVERLQQIQVEIHERFKDLVSERRAGKLVQPHEALFDGSVWTGSEAVALGLIDGIGDVRGVMRARFGEDVRLRPVARERSWLSRRLGIGGSGDQLWLSQAVDALEERALWARFGL